MNLFNGFNGFNHKSLSQRAQELGKLVWVVNMLIFSLNVDADMIKSLEATEKLLSSHITHLNSLAVKIPFRMRQVNTACVMT